MYSFAGVLFPFTSHAARGTVKGTQAFNIVFYSGLAPNNPISGQLLFGNTDASLVFVQQRSSQFLRKIPNARFMSQAWLCPVNCSQSIVHHYMNTKEKNGHYMEYQEASNISMSFLLQAPEQQMCAMQWVHMREGTCSVVGGGQQEYYNHLL